MKNNPEYDRKWYLNNKERIKEKKAAQSKANRKRNLKYSVDYLSTHPCIDCGETDYLVLEYDHRDSSDKFKAVSDIIRGSYSLERVKAEIAKCDVRCANCHRRKTAKQLNWYNFE